MPQTIALIATLNDGTKRRYWIEVPDQYPVNAKEGTVEVPAPEEGEIMYLWDEYLLAAARKGEFGLRLLAEEKPGWTREAAEVGGE